MPLHNSNIFKPWLIFISTMLVIFDFSFTLNHSARTANRCHRSQASTCWDYTTALRPAASCSSASTRAQTSTWSPGDGLASAPAPAAPTWTCDSASGTCRPTTQYSWAHAGRRGARRRRHERTRRRTGGALGHGRWQHQLLCNRGVRNN